MKTKMKRRVLLVQPQREPGGHTGHIHRDQQNVLLLTIQQAEEALGRFALVLEGDALAPRYRDGDTLLVDAAAVPSAGDVVIVEAAGRFGCMLLNADGDAIDQKGGFLSRGSFRLAGVVYEVIPAATALPGAVAAVPPPKVTEAPGEAPEQSGQGQAMQEHPHRRFVRRTARG